LLLLCLWLHGGDIIRRTRFGGCFADFFVLLFGVCERGHALCWGATAVHVGPETGWPVFAESRTCEVVVVVGVEFEDCFVEGVQFAVGDSEFEAFIAPGVLKGGDVGELRALFILDECVHEVAHRFDVVGALDGRW